MDLVGGEIRGIPTSYSSLRLRAACRAALVEARDAMSAAGLRLAWLTAKLRDCPKPGAELAGRVRASLRAISVCRDNIERLDRFRVEVDRAGTAFETVVPIPPSLRVILMPYLADALDPVLAEIQQHPELRIAPHSFLHLLERSEAAAHV